MRILSPERQAQILNCLIEGNSMRSTSRLCDCSINTVTKLFCWLGEACLKYQQETLRNLPCKRLEVDEAWAFCYGKDKNLPEHLRGKEGYGAIWTWAAVDAETRLVPCWHIGSRDGMAANMFITDLASRLANRVQLTSDGHSSYLSAVEDAFGCEVDYAMLVKLYGKGEEGPEQHYSPAQCIGTRKTPIAGSPDLSRASTSYAERINLGLRMGNRRFTRLTNAHSKKLANHKHSVAIHFMVYNFVKIHGSLRCTPAMAAGVSKTVWELSDVIGLLEKPKAASVA